MDPKPLSFPISRRSLLFTAGSVALTIPLLSACGSGDTDAKGSRSKKGTIAKDGVLTIGAAVSTSNVFPHNFNVFGGGDSAPGNAMFWETLFRISSKDGMKLVPNLAKEVKYTSGGKVATYKLRDDVTWNDGKPFTSKDVAFTYGFIFGPPGQSTEKDFKWLAKPIETPDKHTIVVTYNEPQYTEDIPLSLYFPIYPEHIYSKVDHQNYVDKNPVGTGPGKLKSFAGQLIEIDIRDDYWGKKPKGVKTIKLVPAGTAGNIQSQITQGKVDWAEGGDPGVITSFLPMDKDHNGYNYYADGSTRGIILSTHSLPTSDVAVRKALRASVDMGVVAKAGGVGYTVPSVTGLDPVIYANMLKPEFKKPMAPDVEAAKKFLKDAGWTVQNGNLCKDGKEYPLQLTIRNDNPVEMATMPIVVSQWKDNLGINVKFTPLPKEVFDPAQAMGEYDTCRCGRPTPPVARSTPTRCTCRRRTTNLATRRPTATTVAGSAPRKPTKPSRTSRKCRRTTSRRSLVVARSCNRPSTTMPRTFRCRTRVLAACTPPRSGAASRRRRTSTTFRAPVATTI